MARFQEAATHYEKWAELDPNNPKTWFGLGQSYRALSQSYSETLQEKAPDSIYGLLLTAERFFKDGKYPPAFHLYREILKKEPARRGIHQALAEIYRATGHLTWAEVEETREAQIPPPDCQVELFLCDFAAGHFQKVIASASQKHSSQSDYWLSKAYSQLSTAAYEKLTHLPPSSQFHRWKAGVHQAQRRPLQVVAEWKEALRLSPGNRHIKRELALSLRLGRDYEAALPLLRELLAEDPHSIELNLLCADTLLFLQQPAQAVPLLKQALDGDPSSLKAHAALGLALAQTGNAEGAIFYLHEALPLDDEGSLHYQLAQIYRLTGRLESAERTLHRYRQIRRSVTKRLERVRNWMQQTQITPP